MAKVTFHNVQHGEYISIAMKTEKGEDLTVIRDFGAYPSALKEFLKEEANIFVGSTTTKDAILSHSHKDHCNGFGIMQELLSKIAPTLVSKPFRRAYIPYLRYKDASDLGSLMLKVGLYYLYILPKNSVHGCDIKDWIYMVPIMWDLSVMIVGVSQGDTFLDWNQKGTVTWPPAPQDNYYETVIAELKGIVLQIQQELNQNQISIIEGVYEKLREDLSSLVENSWTQNNTTALTWIKSILQPYLELCPGLKIKVNPQLRNSQCKKYLKNIDDHSIVFCLDDNEGNDGLLFLSDLNESKMDMMLPNLKEIGKTEFKAIKSAHHGTRLGSNFLCSVKAQQVIHCCGFGNQKYRGPDSRYISLAPVNICSDWVYNSTKWKDRSKYFLFNNVQYKITI